MINTAADQITQSIRLAETGRLDEATGVVETLLSPPMRGETLDTLATALQTQSNSLPIRRLVVRAYLLTGDADGALALALCLVDSSAALADTLSDFVAVGAWPQHADLLHERASRNPADYDAAIALAAASHNLGRLGDALRWADRAYSLRPHESRPIEIRATALIDRGDVEQGLALYRDLLASHDSAEIAARHLVLMHYDPAQDNARLFDALQAFAHRHVRAFGPPYMSPRSRSPGRRLRIGWLSPRFASGPVASFLTGLLAAFDRNHYRHLLIALRAEHDDATARLRALADEWVDCSALDDAALLQRLRALELDVLIDLAGHSTANRIRVVAQRVAPVQVSWLDWFDTTAIPAMDAWISDGWLTPPDSTQRFTERLLRLPAGRFCYAAPPETPPPTYAGDDRIVFASFNRLAKLNAGVIEAWSAILRRVPDARLELGARLLDDETTRNHTIERFMAHGIAPGRLGLSGQRTYGELLSAYRRVDIALDPFPFSGCTTTCDALLMGSAVITLRGETFVSRQSASLLARLGREEWIARDSVDYVERAVAAAGIIGTLRAAREAQRILVLERLCDCAGQARDFAAVLAELTSGAV